MCPRFFAWVPNEWSGGTSAAHACWMSQWAACAVERSVVAPQPRQMPWKGSRPAPRLRPGLTEGREPSFRAASRSGRTARVSNEFRSSSTEFMFLISNRAGSSLSVTADIAISLPETKCAANNKARAGSTALQGRAWSPAPLYQVRCTIRRVPCETITAYGFGCGGFALSHRV